jgi:hypothetical protein
MMVRRRAPKYQWRMRPSNSAENTLVLFAVSARAKRVADLRLRQRIFREPLPGGTGCCLTSAIILSVTTGFVLVVHELKDLNQLNS